MIEWEVIMENKKLNHILWGSKNQPICDEELEKLTDKEMMWLKSNVSNGNKINRRFNRCQYYPFARDLSFPEETLVLKKWAHNRENIVEIGVFEGASALTFRKVMAKKAVLHLIDPFVVVPDSDLTARPWLAHLKVALSKRGRVIWYKDYSQNVVKDWNDEIDFLFIDGDHSEKACHNDWLCWHGFVKKGGIVAFHDARFMLGDGVEWDGWPGPSKVVNRAFRGENKLPDWEIVEEVGSLVVAQKTL